VEDFAGWARLKFEELFNWRIRELLHCFPKDCVTESGAMFWTGSKRPPEPLEFDPANEFHASFVIAAAKIQMRIYGVEKVPDDQLLRAAASTVVPPWQPTQKKIAVTDEELKPDFVDPQKLEAEVLSLKGRARVLNVEEFEKDDDSNHHMDFVAAAANLRALNYRIGTETRLEIKRIAGKIIPAIATTTAMVVGFICLEMYKMHSPVKRTIGDFRCGTISLAISMFALQQPMPPARVKAAGDGELFSPQWDVVNIDGDPVIGDFVAGIEGKYGVLVIALSCDVGSLMFAANAAKRKKERMEMTISKAVEVVGKGPIPDYTQIFRVEVSARKEGKAVEIPPYVIHFRK
jgi:ubiquitin-activating enzyme E1